MKATVLRTLQDVEQLVHHWPDSAATGPFVLGSFVLEWLVQHRADAEPFVLAIHDPRGRLVAVAPWCLLRRGRRVRELTGAGGLDAGYHDPILADPALSPAVSAALVTCLREHRRQWDYLTFTLEPEASAPLIRDLRRLGRLFTIKPSWRFHQHAELEGGWDSYRKGHASVFKSAERRARKLADRPHRYLLADALTYQPFLDELFRLHHLHLGHTRDWAPQYELLRAVCAHGIERGEVFLVALEIEGRLVAMDLALRSGSTVCGVMRSYDREFASLGVGQLLTVWAFEQYYRAGARRIDFGGGYYDWKESFQTGVLELSQFQLASSWLALPHLAWTPILKTWVKRYPALWELAKRWQKPDSASRPPLAQPQGT